MGGPQVFKFPKDLQRCRIWVKNSGNLELLKLPPEKLCVLRHLCAAHFTKDQFWNNTGRILKKYAVPTFFSVNPLSDNEMSEFPATRDYAVNMCTVRGAPAIAIVGCLSLAVELQKEVFNDKKIIRQEVEGKLNYLVSARPTAVNMKLAAQVLINFINELDENDTVGAEEMKRGFISAIEAMLEKDIVDNRAIGEAGAQAILAGTPEDNAVRILTHCNTGSLATAGYGTALGIVRTLHAHKRLEHVYCTETRPYNQGARLTAYELVHERIPSTLVCDSMVAALMRSRSVSAVVVGADRVAANGDTANKIGTYQIAVVARHHNVPFYVAAPFTSIDSSIPSGEYIVIEERPDHEMTHIGEHRIAAPGIGCWNPAFDVTPAPLITAIITERGVYKPNELQKYV